MKKPIVILSVFTVLLLAGASCTQKEETGTLQFGLTLSDDSSLKAAAPGQLIASAVVSIRDENGQLVYDKEVLPVFRFGDAFTTRTIKLEVGSYRLSECMLVDSAGMVLWATPRTGSALAHLVRDPLPVSFRISPDQETSVGIQVIRVRDFSAEDFGYATFRIEFVDRFCLKVLYASRCQDLWNDSIAGPAGSDAPYLQPRIQIRNHNRVLVDEALNEGLNRYTLPLGIERYAISATDCRGDTFFTRIFPLKELLTHRCGDNFLPLLIRHPMDSTVLITPEGLNEPTIAQGVFGRLTIPLNDSTQTESYDVRPAIRDVYLYPYAVMDSVFSFSPIDCYFHFPISTPPVVIVRSNSDGYFQAPLEPGEYLYLVKLQGGFYIDYFVSSHPPGQVIIRPQEVTKLMIQIIDCSMWM